MVPTPGHSWSHASTRLLGENSQRLAVPVMLEESGLSLGDRREGCPDLQRGLEIRLSTGLSVTDGTPDGPHWPTDISICRPQPAVTQPPHSIPAQQLLVCGHTEGAQAPVRKRSGSPVLWCASARGWGQDQHSIPGGGTMQLGDWGWALLLPYLLERHVAILWGNRGKTR